MPKPAGGPKTPAKVLYSQQMFLAGSLPLGFGTEGIHPCPTANICPLSDRDPPGGRSGVTNTIYGSICFLSHDTEGSIAALM